MTPTDSPLKNCNPPQRLCLPNTPAIRSSFISAISSASSFSISSSLSPPSIDFYDSIVAQSYPDPSEYDLIVLSGGTEDPSGSVPWVLKMRRFVRDTVERYPAKKIVGFVGDTKRFVLRLVGRWVPMEAAEIGVTRVELMATGKNMFPFAENGKMQLHEFHKREIKVPAKRFEALAKKNQIFLNDQNTVLTIQGHPEMNTELAKSMLQKIPSYMGVDEEKRREIAEKMGGDHDGVRIWKRILDWVKE